jgi:hypothetical protein
LTNRKAYATVITVNKLKTNMLRTIFNPLLIGLTLFTTVGVLVHDTQLDRATTVAVALPAAVAGFALDTVLKSGDAHTHVERVSAPKQFSLLRATLPRVQPRDNDRVYIQHKKAYFAGGETTSLWPSV